LTFVELRKSLQSAATVSIAVNKYGTALRGMKVVFLETEVAQKIPTTGLEVSDARTFPSM
jgi:hypothetical protein